MPKNDILDNLDKIAKAVAATFGPSCETAVCDFENCKIVTLENGHVTGRMLGGSIDPSVVQHFSRTGSNYQQYIAYPSQSLINGKLLKCSTVIISDESNRPVASFSINVDVSMQNESSDLRKSLLSSAPVAAPTLPAPTDERSYDSVLDYTRKVIDDVLIFFNSNVGKPLSLASKEDKLRVLRELDRQDVLQVRDMVPSVCEMLSISQATLYNYLKEIRSDGGTAAAKTTPE